jgi:D-aspartate ligase
VVEADREVPALVVKVGSYPIHSGGVGAARALGRLGVPVHVITEDRFTPLALSRYSALRFISPATGAEDPDVLVGRLTAIGRRIGRPTVAVATDDEAAILLAEHADELSRYLLLPRVPPDLPRQLASKQQLSLLCRQHDVPTPWTILLRSRAELAECAERMVYPVVAKNPEPWVRLSAPVVGSTTMLQSKQELVQLATADHEQFRVLIQEFIPPQDAEDWIVHLYSATNSDRILLFTGIKVRSWPRDAGPTACAYAVPNPALAELTERFCRVIGFRGIADLDWRLDRRDGQYKLVDFNPRVGNQFPLFRTDAGVDVVTALHLDLTGRGIPPGQQVDGRRIVVEHYDIFARLAYRQQRHPIPQGNREGGSSTVLAWAVRDDPLPFVAVFSRLAVRLLFRLVRRLLGVNRGSSQRHLTRAGRGAAPGRHEKSML